MLPLGNDLRALEKWANEFDNRLGTIEQATGIRTPTVSGSTLDTEFVAGTGMSGGGFLSYGLLTFNVGAGTGITVNADTIELDAAYRGANPTGTIGLSAVNGTATSYLRSDGAPALSQAIVPTWTGIHTFTPEAVFNGGIDLGTSGRFDSNVADAANADSFLFKPSVALTSGVDRNVFAVEDSAAYAYIEARPDGSLQLTRGTGSAASGGLVNVQSSTALNFGIKFQITGSGSGSNIVGWSSAVCGAIFSVIPSATPGASNYIGGGFEGGSMPILTSNVTSVWGAGFRAFTNLGSNGSRTFTEVGGWKVWPILLSSVKNMGTVTAWYGGYVSNSLSASAGGGSAVTNAYGIYLEEQDKAATGNYEVWIAGAGGLWFRDSNLYIASNADGYLDSHADTDIRENVKGLAGSTVANAYKKTDSTTVANTATETSLVGTGTGTVTLPANFLIAGRTVRVHAAGYYSDDASPGTVDVRVRLGGVGGTVILDTTALTPAGAVSNQLWEMDAYLTCRTTGATGTIFAQGHVTLHDTTAASRVYEMVNTATTTIDTTAAQAVTPTLQWGTADPDNTLTCTNMTVEWL